MLFYLRLKENLNTMYKNTKRIIPIFFSILLLSCSNKAKNDTVNRDMSNEQTQIETKVKAYADKDLYVQADSLEIVQVNPNVTRKMTHLDNLMVTIVEFTNGPMDKPDPFHSHIHEQMTYIAEGECMVLIGDTKQKLKAGDIFAVPSNVPHSVQSLNKKLKLIDTFSPIRADFLSQKQ